jgi:hypothetical protein
VSEDTTVYEFTSGRKRFRARVHVYRGRTLLDLRELWQPEPDGPYVPTKSGISVLATNLEQLESAVAAMRAALPPNFAEAA